MRYLLLSYRDEGLTRRPTSEDAAEFEALERELSSRGTLELTAWLAPASSTTTVRVRDGRILVYDGPAAETRDQLAALALAAFDSIEAAAAAAARAPAARASGIEVRVAKGLCAPADA